MLKEKKCAECGKVFQPKSGTQRYCPGPHLAVCEFCGKSFQYSCSPKEKPRYCSQQCINDGKRRTVQAKYGVENVSQLDTVRKKISDANSSEEVRKKRRQTSLQNWGVDNPAKSELVKAKMSEVMSSEEYLGNRRQTCLERYGAESPMQNDAVKVYTMVVLCRQSKIAVHAYISHVRNTKGVCSIAQSVDVEMTFKV